MRVLGFCLELFAGDLFFVRTSVCGDGTATCKSFVFDLGTNLIGWYWCQGRTREVQFLLVSFLGAADFTCQQHRGAEARLGPLGFGSCQVTSILQFSSCFFFFFVLHFIIASNSTDLALNSEGNLMNKLWTKCLTLKFTSKKNEKPTGVSDLVSLVFVAWSKSND